MSVSGIRTAVAALKKQKAPKWDNGNYRAVMNCDAILGLQGDTAAGNWINVHMYNSAENAELLKKGVIGTLYGVDIVETNQAFCSSAGSSDATPGDAGAAARDNFFAGKGAVAEVKLQGNGDARIIYKESGPTDTSNPLEMYSTLGWKVEGYCAKVLNPNWLIKYVAWGTGTALTGATAEV
jgi:N4-gp56 family major capsid protein